MQTEREALIAGQSCKRPHETGLRRIEGDTSNVNPSAIYDFCGFTGISKETMAKLILKD